MLRTSVRLSRLSRQATAGFATELTPLHDHLALSRVRFSILGPPVLRGSTRCCRGWVQWRSWGLYEALCFSVVA